MLLHPLESDDENSGDNWLNAFLEFASVNSLAIPALVVSSHRKQPHDEEIVGSLSILSWSWEIAQCQAERLCWNPG
jgi:hypothetical protein